MDDSISRKWLMECVEEGWIKFDTQEDENRFVHLITKMTGQENGTYRSVYGYYSTIYAAVKGYRDMVVRNMVRGGDYELAALISKIRGVDERLKDTLETCIKA